MDQVMSQSREVGSAESIDAATHHTRLYNSDSSLWCRGGSVRGLVEITGACVRPCPTMHTLTTGVYVVMGVAGAGKSVVGALLAHALGVDFVEGDDYHPPENRHRMSIGIPLTDDDRRGWLLLLAARLKQAKDTGRGVVMSCSALKRSYRDLLRSEAGEVRFIYLRGPRDLLAERLAHRPGHFMPPSLLDSQLATLEEPTADEGAWVYDISDAPEKIVAALVERVSSSPR